VNAPILVLPESGNCLSIYGCLTYRAGCVLMQKGRVITCIYVVEEAGRELTNTRFEVSSRRYSEH
jgi:hypothetical protein